ncbi:MULTISPECIES: DUF4367 domain-containing protein [Bacteria]|uniref:DUF4367 domain-containing protein n=2 Tax=cellular organisms TaxID=131567 RepID=UPI0005972CB0|nr:DUF4367 domain-containing protein [Bacillus badius]KIL71859.1 hypothetical protein SD78_1307 [Bacillus badius]MED0665615.1 DUF4367 domain-containing protein [Bacillus badius]OVE45992.1 DUF4367 domain-containing protein [Bacillus badius]TDV97340.1 uncharacterized protein DUF4367 [Bacillus badius]UAT33119.1 DUF4367 domain-containing protein [Bacillus badius]
MVNTMLACFVFMNSVFFTAIEPNIELKSELSKVEENVDFKVFIPENYNQWKLIIKSLAFDKKNPDSVLITFEDKETKGKYIFECIQTKSNGDHPENGSIVNVNHNKARFTPWAASRNNQKPVGGILTWNQNGTNIEMKSSYLTKEEMIQIAKKMK